MNKNRSGVPVTDSPAAPDRSLKAQPAMPLISEPSPTAIEAAIQASGWGEDGEDVTTSLCAPMAKILRAAYAIDAPREYPCPDCGASLWVGIHERAHICPRQSQPAREDVANALQICTGWTADGIANPGTMQAVLWDVSAVARLLTSALAKLDGASGPPNTQEP